MQVELGEVPAGALGELGHGPDAGVGAAVVAAPHREGRAPEAVARQRPVDVVLQPVAEAPVLDVRRVPPDGLVLAQQLVLVRGGACEPRGLRPVDEGRAAAPAVRIGVRVVDHALEPPGRRERVDDRGVGVLHEGARPGGGPAGGRDERRGRAHRVDHREPLGVGDLAVDLTEPGREVHDARTVVDGHEVGGDHARRHRRRARGSRTGARSAVRPARRPAPVRAPRRRRPTRRRRVPQPITRSRRLRRVDP